VPTYLMTHPAVDDRIAYIDSWLAIISKSSAPKAPAKNEDFQRVHIKLVTQYGDEETVLANSRKAVEQRPDDALAHYQYGLILARIGKREEGIRQIQIALEKRAFDPYILNDLGRIYFLDGQYEKSLNILESVRSMTPEDPECLLYLGQAQTELGRLKEASETFYKLVQNRPQYKMGYYFLGQTLGKQDNLADAYYYLGLYYLKDRDYKTAQAQLQRALKLTNDIQRKQEIEKILSTLTSPKT